MLSIAGGRIPPVAPAILLFHSLPPPSLPLSRSPALLASLPPYHLSSPGDQNAARHAPCLTPLIAFPQSLPSSSTSPSLHPSFRTQLDRSDSESFKQREIRAERLANEIETKDMVCVCVCGDMQRGV